MGYRGNCTGLGARRSYIIFPGLALTHPVTSTRCVHPLLLYHQLPSGNSTGVGDTDRLAQGLDTHALGELPIECGCWEKGAVRAAMEPCSGLPVFFQAALSSLAHTGISAIPRFYTPCHAKGSPCILELHWEATLTPAHLSSLTN